MSASLQPPIQWSAEAIVIANKVATPPWKFLGRETRSNGKVRFTFLRTVENPMSVRKLVIQVAPDFAVEKLKSFFLSCISAAEEEYQPPENL